MPDIEDILIPKVPIGNLLPLIELYITINFSIWKHKFSLALNVEGIKNLV